MRWVPPEGSNVLSVNRLKNMSYVSPVTGKRIALKGAAEASKIYSALLDKLDRAIVSALSPRNLILSDFPNTEDSAHSWRTSQESIIYASQEETDGIVEVFPASQPGRWGHLILPGFVAIEGALTHILRTFGEEIGTKLWGAWSESMPAWQVAHAVLSHMAGKDVYDIFHLPTTNSSPPNRPFIIAIPPACDDEADIALDYTHIRPEPNEGDALHMSLAIPTPIPDAYITIRDTENTYETRGTAEANPIIMVAREHVAIINADYTSNLLAKRKSEPADADLDLMTDLVCGALATYLKYARMGDGIQPPLPEGLADIHSALAGKDISRSKVNNTYFNLAQERAATIMQSTHRMLAKMIEIATALPTLRTLADREVAVITDQLQPILRECEKHPSVARASIEASHKDGVLCSISMRLKPVEVEIVDPRPRPEGIARGKVLALIHDARLNVDVKEPEIASDPISLGHPSYYEDRPAANEERNALLVLRPAALMLPEKVMVGDRLWDIMPADFRLGLQRQFQDRPAEVIVQLLDSIPTWEWSRAMPAYDANIRPL